MKPHSPPPRSNRVRSVLGWIGAVVFSVLVTELFLRAIDQPKTEMEFLGPELADESAFVPDADLFWRLDPATDVYIANDAGFRGWWPRGGKEPNELRIVCVGDSCSFGVGVDYEEAWGVRLERLVQALRPDREVRTTLAALPGYSTQQQVRLLEKFAAELSPDLTIFYVGTWNDYVPAMRFDDEERARRHDSWIRSNKLFKLFERAFVDDSGEGAIREELLAAFRGGGELRYGRRVPIEKLHANYARLIELAQTAGSRVLMVVPPLPVGTVDDFPIIREYRVAIREIAAEHDIELVDVAAVIDAFDASLPEDFRFTQSGEFICFVDWAHPSPLGHALIADAVFEHLRDSDLLPETRGGAAPSTTTIESVSPERLAALAGGSLRLEGSGFAAPGTTERVWVGRHWIRDVGVEGDGALVLDLPDTLSPGAYTVELATPHGPVDAPAPVVVEPLPIEATLLRDDDELRLTVTVRARPGLQAAAWLSTELRDPPAATRYGPFLLVAEPDGRPPGRADVPFRFDKLTLPGWLGETGPDGAWTLDTAIPLGDATALPKRVFLQGGVRDPANESVGALTVVAELDVPR